ncbi:cobalamin B12-binding domain-containing protein [Amycolatopsis sp. H20-H5]|uniref:cobalamin B12-binding domain-containing protein n=1 Tax=Amycolatopsis sp. H20-H5 TaxID=3046309 RepID=UPI002DB705CF|nr:cobalamin B12-binding domain-containing protein [Amycolatopsis sp. H20-H5]MEC3982578.1 cobalamin B12-binding domain-containing protein [Amycolatopsis sp. H20-H5]
MAPESPLDDIGRFDLSLSTVDTESAVSQVEKLLDDGVAPVTVLSDVIVAAQAKVGQRWQRGEWTVAQEHAATAVAIAATEAVGRYARRVPVTRGHVLVTCAEREWHALPATIIGYAMRSGGWDVTLLGASAARSRLTQHLHDVGPDAVAVSCSVLGALPATRRFIEASAAAGIPVIVGGPAFSYDPLRALALGATAWAPDVRQAVVALNDLPAVIPPALPLPVAPAAEQADLDRNRRRLVAAVDALWSVTAGDTATGPATLDSLRAVAGDVVKQSLNAVSAALITNDPRAVAYTAEWVEQVLTARGADTRAVVELGEVLARVLGAYPLAHDLVDRHWARSTIL